MRFTHSTIQPPPSRWPSIIGTLVVALSLGGCGTVRMVYDNAPALTYWWLDGYFDFDAEQGQRLRAELDALHQWHRTHELPLLAEQLAKLQALASKPVRAAQICKLSAQLQAHFRTLVEHSAPTLEALAPTLTSAQLQHVDQTFAKRNAEWVRDNLEPSTQDHTARSIKKMIERVESFYGDLTPEQVALVRNQIETTEFDPGAIALERNRRREDALQVLEQLQSGTLNAAQRKKAVAALLERTLTPPDAAYREYMARVTDQTCTHLAALHNSMSAAQRAKLAQTLSGYEQDLRALIK